MTTAANDCYESVNWTTPRMMATTLMRRHRDDSTVRMLVNNEFGRAPSVDLLADMRKRMPAELVPGGALTPHLGDIESHAFDMQDGSERLLRAIWQKHQRVMLVAKARGRRVVIPGGGR